uniref:Uncharacterized protein n=1 Tax=Amphimedon queenslandica TaxID=400682 RepID=A0A1X7TCK2_AMPQE
RVRKEYYYYYCYYYCYYYYESEKGILLLFLVLLIIYLSLSHPLSLVINLDFSSIVLLYNSYSSFLIISYSQKALILNLILSI